MREGASRDVAKRAAAMAAVGMVADGMALGLGTGSTVAFALVALARRIREEGLRITGVPTSVPTEARARELGIPLTTLADKDALDLAIDGADEVETSHLFLIKGHGGALLREKIVASSARMFVVIVDETKIVAALGTRGPVPVEVARFAHEATARRLRPLLGRATLRCTPEGAPFVTDNGNFIYDVTPGAPITDPIGVERELRSIPGVLACGLFTGPVARVFAGSEAGTVRVLRPGA